MDYFDKNSPRSGADASNSRMDRLHGQVDEPRGSVDALNASNKAGAVGISHRDSATLDARDAERNVNKTDSAESHADTSIGHGDTPSIQTDALIPANMPETISTNPTELQLPDSLTRGENCRANNSQGLGNPADTLNMCTHAYSIVNDTRTPINVIKIINTHPNDSKSQSSPVGDAKHAVDETDGIGSHTGVPSIHTDTLKPANTLSIISIPQTKPKLPDLPGDSARLALNRPNDWGSHTDMSSARTNVQSVGNDTLTPRSGPQTVETCRNGQKWPNSPGEGTRWAPDKPNSFYSHMDASNTRTGMQSVAHETETPANAPECIKTA